MKNAIITSKIKKMYDIEVEKNTVHIFNPVYINIDRDNEYQVTRSEVTLTIQNSKVSVALWLSTRMMHVTVYS